MYVEYITTSCPGSPGRQFSGGAYAYGETTVRDYWTGAVVAQRQWCSGAVEFPWCPRDGGFARCTCERHDDLYPQPVVETWRNQTDDNGQEVLIRAM